MPSGRGPQRCDRRLDIHPERLSRASATPVTLAYETVEYPILYLCTAEWPTRCASENDFVQTAGILVFSPGETVKTFVVDIVGDDYAEASEAFVVRLVPSTNVSIFGNEVNGSIHDDDPAILLEGWGSVAEGNSGTTSMTFWVCLNMKTNSAVSVKYSTRRSYNMASQYVAEAPSDYRSVSGTLTFAPGEVRKSITVLVNGDRLKEQTEWFDLVLSQPTNGEIWEDHAYGQIRNDD